jgi:hypothetical protein
MKGGREQDQDEHRASAQRTALPERVRQWQRLTGGAFRRTMSSSHSVKG